jgi:outer membrane lipoprotein-sorting protein
LVRLTWKCLLPWLLVGLAAPLCVWGAEFTAKMVLREHGQDVLGKIYVKDGKMRQDFIDDRGQTITIVRRDKHRVWVILPSKNTYVEMPLGLHLPGQFLQVPPEAISKRQVCREEMNGYQVDRIEVTLRGGPLGTTRQTFWVAPKLGLPIKTVTQDRQYSVEYREIQEKKLEDRLFEVPPGYRQAPGPSDLP